MGAPTHLYALNPHVTGNPMLRAADRRYTQTVLDLSQLSESALEQLTQLDGAWVGTERYMGLGAFWHAHYERWLAAASPMERKALHDYLREEGLPYGARSEQHDLAVRYWVQPPDERAKDLLAP
jgi:hypothetical protein